MSPRSSASLSPPKDVMEIIPPASAISVDMRTRMVSMAPAVVGSTGKTDMKPLPSPGLSRSAVAQNHTQPPQSALSHASRLDTWRTEVHTSNSPKHETPLRSVSIPATVLSDASRSRSFDYTQPRKLHEDISPPLLSTYDEPIRRVVEDMREQRMSLCQSLRQYVFVHRAVIEGALMIVDEEKERAKREATAAVARRSREAAPAFGPPSHARDQHEVGPVIELQKPIHASGPSLGSPFVLCESTRKASHPVPTVMEEVPFSGPPISPGKVKRGASPTELQKQGLDGAPALSKRVSLKRPHRQVAGSPAQQLAFELKSRTSASTSPEAL